MDAVQTTKVSVSKNKVAQAMTLLSVPNQVTNQKHQKEPKKVKNPSTTSTNSQTP